MVEFTSNLGVAVAVTKFYLLLAQLNVVLDGPALNGGAHHRGLSDPGLQLPLRRQVDDHRQVDNRHRREHRHRLRQHQKSIENIFLIDTLYVIQRSSM